jgi:tetratricopeptide (TPR) repeat protein
MNYKSLLLTIFLLGSNISVVLPAVSAPTPTPTASPTAKPSSAELLFDARNKAMDGDYPAAQKLYDQAIQQEPQNSQAYVERAEFKDEYLKDFPGALADYDQAIKINPKLTSAWYGRVDIKLNRLNDPQGALTDLDLLVAIDPQEPNSYLMRGIVNHIRLKQYPAALNDYNRAIELSKKGTNPAKSTILPDLTIFNTAYTYYLRASLKAEKMNDPTGAINDCTEVIKDKSPAFRGLAYNLRGWIKFSKFKNFSGAEADLQQALKLNSKGYFSSDYVAYNTRALIRYEGRRNITGAISDLNQALKISPKNNLILYNRGELQYKVGRKKEALKDFRAIVSAREVLEKQNPKNLRAEDKYELMAAGIIALENKSWSEAIAKFDQVIKEDTDTMDAYKYRGIAKLGQGKQAEGKADLQQAATMYQDSNMQQSYQIVRGFIQESPN